ncbi:MAG TPA: transcription antitermination factor NusB [Acidimicrobiales bacterium]|nr:transcription antitermination factor NusB [Acidimicrobiales bacterium]
MSLGGAGVAARRVAVEALLRIDEGAYANLVVPAVIGRSRLAERDRALATELAYGGTRMRRACDFLVDRFLRGPVEGPVRVVLRMGAYQLHWMGLPPHAVVSTTVECAPRRARGLVNAVLRRVADAGPVEWPDPAIELSYPDWIVQRLSADLGGEAARAALEQMNRPPAVTVRADGYVQDRASQWVAGYVPVEAGDIVADVCAAPGGKATALAHRGPSVVAALDVREGRAGLVRENAARVGATSVGAVVGDGTRAPLRRGAFDRVLVDAPCSGLGVLRRRPDARWRVESDAPGRLQQLQQRLLAEAAALVRPGGTLVYSVCTLTAEETVGVDAWAEVTLPSFGALAPPGDPWRGHGRGALLLPQDADTDGMFVLGLERVRR